MFILICLNQDQIYNKISPFNEWFKEHPVYGFMAFSGLYLIWIPTTLPASIMTLSGGYIFSSMYGKVKGYLLCALAIWIGHPPSALLTFLIGRYFLKTYI